MSAVVRQEIIFFVVSVLTGIALICAYGLLIIFRRVVKHKAFAVSIEDFLYWMLVGLVIFGMIFEENSGALRGYSFAGILAGAWAGYNVTQFFRKICIIVLKKCGKRVKMTKDKGNE